MRSFLALAGTEGLGELLVTSGLGPLAFVPPPPPPPRPPLPVPLASGGGGGGGGGASFPLALVDERCHQVDPVVEDFYARAWRQEPSETEASVPLLRPHQDEGTKGEPLAAAEELEPDAAPAGVAAIEAAPALPSHDPPPPRAARPKRSVHARDRFRARVRTRPLTAPSPRSTPAPFMWPAFVEAEIAPVEVIPAPAAAPMAAPSPPPTLSWSQIAVLAVAGIALGVLAGLAYSAYRRRREERAEPASLAEDNPMATDQATLSTYAVMFDGADNETFRGSIDKMHVSAPNWLELFPGVFLVTSPLCARDLVASIRARRPEIGRLLVVDTAGDRGGIAPKEAWSMMRNPVPAGVATG